MATIKKPTKAQYATMTPRQKVAMGLGKKGDRKKLGTFDKAANLVRLKKAGKAADMRNKILAARTPLPSFKTMTKPLKSVQKSVPLKTGATSVPVKAATTLKKPSAGISAGYSRGKSLFAKPNTTPIGIGKPKPKPFNKYGKVGIGKQK